LEEGNRRKVWGKGSASREKGILTADPTGGSGFVARQHKKERKEKQKTLQKGNKKLQRGRKEKR